MRDVISVPIALLCYVVAVAIILALCNWFFEKPSEWSYVIPIITSTFSFALAYVVAEEKFSSKAGAKITAVIIAAFWIIFVVVDISGSIDNLIRVLAGKNIEPDALDVIMMYVDVLLNSKIFAVVSCLLAAGQVNSKI